MTSLLAQHDHRDLYMPLLLPPRYHSQHTRHDEGCNAREKHGRVHLKSEKGKSRRSVVALRSVFCAQNADTDRYLPHRANASNNKRRRERFLSTIVQHHTRACVRVLACPCSKRLCDPSSPTLQRIFWKYAIATRSSPSLLRHKTLTLSFNNASRNSTPCRSSHHHHPLKRRIPNYPTSLEQCLPP